MGLRREGGHDPGLPRPRPGDGLLLALVPGPEHPVGLIDATIQLEIYERGEERHLPEFVLVENPRSGEVDAEDIASADEFFQMAGEPLSLEAVTRRDPYLLPIAHRWGVKAADFPGVTVKYIPTQLTAAWNPIETMTDNIDCGTLPVDLFREYERGRSS